MEITAPKHQEQRARHIVASRKLGGVSSLADSGAGASGPLGVAHDAEVALGLVDERARGALPRALGRRHRR